MLFITSQFNKIPYRNLSFRKIKNWYAGLHHPGPPQPPYNHIIQIGDPRLKCKSEIVRHDIIQSVEIQNLIIHLKSVLRKYNSVGLSSPQIGIPFRVFVIEFTEKKLKEIKPDVRKAQKMMAIPFTVFINPDMKTVNYNKVKFTEACESVKGFSADVARYEEVEVVAFNENGTQFKFQADGWTARIIQHEMDHLNGKIFTDIMDRNTLACTCWQVVNDHRGKVELPYYPS